MSNGMNIGDESAQKTTTTRNNKTKKIDIVIYKCQKNSISFFSRVKEA
jgi:hypothetical protein